MGHKRPKFKKETSHFALTKYTYHERIDLVLKTDDNKPKALCLLEFGRILICVYILYRPSFNYYFFNLR